MTGKSEYNMTGARSGPFITHVHAKSIGPP